MKIQPWCSVTLAGVSLTAYGLKVPSPFCSLTLSNSEVTSMTSFNLNVTVGGDSSKKVNVAAFEALLYSAAQTVSDYPNASGIPVSFAFGWLNEQGRVVGYLSYQGFTLKFNVSTSGMYMQYSISGFAKLAMQTSIPVLKIPAICGYVQPSAVLTALLDATKANLYYEYDIDRCDNPVLMESGDITTSLIDYVRGTYNGVDDYTKFPGLCKLAKSYNATREASGLDTYKANTLSQVLNNASRSDIRKFLKETFCDTSPQCSSFSFWITEPTATEKGVIHFKCDAGLLTNHSNEVLQYGTKDTNILSLNGSYNGVAYNMTNMNFKNLGFSVDASGNDIVNDATVVNSWSARLTDVYKTANIINDINAIASQFSGDFTVTIPGSLTKYTVAQPVSLLIMTGNTVSPATGVYSIMSVSHTIDSRFTTQLKLQRLTLGTANQVASAQNIFVNGSSNYSATSVTQTKNIENPYKVNLPPMYPDMTDIYMD